MGARKTASTEPTAGADAGGALKRALLAQLLAQEEQALAVMEEAAQIARAAAAHEEMKPENDKDTRALEAGYLASGQSARAAALRKSVRDLSALTPRKTPPDASIELLALVEVIDEDHKRAHYFIAPTGGGKRLSALGSSVLVITAGSPLGDALLGKRAGDIVEVSLGGHMRELSIVAVG